jgi:hypothetical protein
MYRTRPDILAKDTWLLSLSVVNVCCVSLYRKGKDLLETRRRRERKRKDLATNNKDGGALGPALRYYRDI